MVLFGYVGGRIPSESNPGGKVVSARRMVDMGVKRAHEIIGTTQ